MVSSRGTDINIRGSQTEGYTILATAFDRSKVEQVLNEHWIAFSTRKAGPAAEEPDETEFVFTKTTDAESIQEILDSAP